MHFIAKIAVLSCLIGSSQLSTSAASNSVDEKEHSSIIFGYNNGGPTLTVPLHHSMAAAFQPFSTQSGTVALSSTHNSAIMSASRPDSHIITINQPMLNKSLVTSPAMRRTDEFASAKSTQSEESCLQCKECKLSCSALQGFNFSCTGFKCGSVVNVIKAMSALENSSKYACEDNKIN